MKNIGVGCMQLKAMQGIGLRCLSRDLSIYQVCQKQQRAQATAKNRTAPHRTAYYAPPRRHKHEVEGRRAGPESSQTERPQPADIAGIH